MHEIQLISRIGEIKNRKNQRDKLFKCNEKMSNNEREK